MVFGLTQRPNQRVAQEDSVVLGVSGSWREPTKDALQTEVLMKVIALACAGLVGWAVGTMFAQELPPELAEPAAKYKATVESLDKQRLATVAQASQSYVATLDEIKKAATAKGDVKTSEAAAKERDAALAGKLPPDLPAGLPALRLQGTRKALLMKLEPVNADFGKRKKRLDGEYLGFLDSLKQKADPESALAKRIEAEKEALLADEKASNEKPGDEKKEAKVSRGKNVVVNGDFEKVTDNWPIGWERVAGVTIEKENGNTFVRFEDKAVDNDGSVGVKVLRQDFDLPKGVKAVMIAARLRTTGCVSHAKVYPIIPQVEVYFMNPDDKVVGHISAGWNNRNGAWMNLQKADSVSKDSVKAYVQIVNGKCPGQIDFDDIEVTFK